MYLQPAESTRAKGFYFCEYEQPTGKVISNVAQVRWDGVGATTEIEIMRQVESIAQELSEKISEV